MTATPALRARAIARSLVERPPTVEDMACLKRLGLDRPASLQDHIVRRLLRRALLLTPARG
jgi:hypothetical protein